MSRIFRLLILTLIFSISALGIFMAQTQIILMYPGSILTIISAVISGLILFIVYKFLMRYV